MEDKDKYGILLQPSIKMHRQYFREMVKLLGIHVLYRAPYPNKHYTTYGEIDSNYEQPRLVGCLFENHPNQKTLKKLGWASELEQEASIITVDYDLPNLQQGALFIIPSGLDDGKGRLFRVTELSTTMVYPASVTCKIIPEYIDTFNEEAGYDFKHNNFTLIDEEEMPIQSYYTSIMEE